MNDNIKIGADINAGDGGYSIGTQEKYDNFVKGRNQSLGKMRIKELVNKVGTDVSGKWMGIDNVEMFAELIIAECMKLNCKELSITAIERLLPLYKDRKSVV